MYQDSEPIVLLVKPFVWWRSRGVAAWFCWSSLSHWYESYEVLSFAIKQKFREVSGGNHQHKCFVFSLFDLTFLFWVNRFLSLKVKIIVEPRVIKIRRKNEGNFSHRSPPGLTGASHDRDRPWRCSCAFTALVLLVFTNIGEPLVTTTAMSRWTSIKNWSYQYFTYETLSHLSQLQIWKKAINLA